MEKILISLIVPVFNTPTSDFERCMNGILSQSYKNLEIIVIDDGSELANSDFYRMFCNKDSRIQYVYSKNAGVSSARNKGIKLAKGEYIAFVDSDDYLYEDFVSNSLKEARKSNADLVIGRVKYIPHLDTQQCIANLIVEKRIDVVLSYVFSIERENMQCRVLGSVCGRLFRANIVKNVLFDEKIKYWEDQIYLRKFIEESNIIAIIPEDWYLYYQNSYSSIHHSFTNWDCFKDWQFFLDTWVSLNQREQDFLQKKLLDKYLIIFFFQFIREAILSGFKFDRAELLRVLNCDAFSYLINSVKYADYYQKTRKIQLFLMRHKFVFFAYFFVKFKILLSKSYLFNLIRNNRK